MREIFVVNADGTGLTQITHGVTGQEFSAAPDWSPDGTKITFHRTGPSTWVMNADGSGAVGPHGSRRGTTTSRSPSWSPDGTKIVFRRQGGIWTMNADGTNQTQLTVHGPGHAEDTQPHVVAGRDADPLRRLDRRCVQLRPRRHQRRTAAAA